jgi:hypothetical protein
LRVPDNGIEDLPLDQGELVAHVYGRCGLEQLFCYSGKVVHRGIRG